MVRVLGVADVAAILGVSTKTVYETRLKGADPIPHTWSMTNELQIDPAAFGAWLARQNGGAR